MWFNALHSALAALTLKALRLASALPDPPQLQHIGWLARRHCLQVSDPARFVPRKSRIEGVSTKMDPRSFEVRSILIFYPMYIFACIVINEWLEICCEICCSDYAQFTSVRDKFKI